MKAFLGKGRSDGNIMRRRAAHIEIGMLVKLYPTSHFRHGIAEVFVSWNGFSFELITITPFKQGEVGDIDMACTFGGGTSFDHKNGTRIVDEKLGEIVLGKTEISQDGANVERAFTSFGCRNEFRLSAGECNLNFDNV